MAKDKTIITSGLTVPEVFKIGDTEVNKETLLAQREADVKLVINGVDDKEGYKKAHALRAQYRTVRTTLEKHRKDISAPFQAYVKQLKETTDELGKIAQVGEDYFDTIMTEIDDEKARIAKEKELAEQKRIAGRINELVALGATFDGENYTFPYSETFMVSSDEVNSFSDMEMFEVMEDAKQLYSTEQQRMNDELLKQQEVEEARLAEVEAQRIIAETNALEATKLLNKRTALRVKELSLMGFKEDDGAYSHVQATGYISIDGVQTMTDDDWEFIIEDMNAKIESYVEPAPVFEAPNTMDNLINDYMGSDSEIPSGNPVSDPDQSYVTNDVLEEPLSNEPHNIILNFYDKWLDSDVTPKTFLRVFPEQFELEAINDCVVMSQGTVQSLGWAIIKR